ncbi:hypothetical protein MJO28_006212 [Puccinia striiformis f. sp. tritici]|uniref:Protein CPL1-like domain-containing protein n=4 Tax=Puccinia striiformis TaxID=27350 RepID=A0A0L0VLX1_9BASI|nr:hypothetical protein Pst134EA_011409 [Puccinia striiformis f. sp. tritici]KAI9605005.1 hypothetical protein H4Q26_002976 [Puccinia striiformis f. sp. tritici PST-130]KNE99974.1 hypothetical protein PSTG_06826 [Puccinia striiformis f. sp. tritici PST-78]POW16223.1 hypothetical protein PSHT_06823 [Puccinia striiformis]KAH9456187.1 hypothetical protein Pst134EB_012391 [Puccinia striiformis f. sp. tritici]KAH9467784.1 hypothetical protein Pst134EA_011409 [Puccinia striiformis f. sp. tritici]
MNFHSVKLFVILCGFVLSQSAFEEDYPDHSVDHLDTPRHPSRVITTVQDHAPAPRLQARQPVPSGSFGAPREAKKAIDRISGNANKCPLPTTSCPILSSNQTKKLLARTHTHKNQTIVLPWECVNLQEELTACGTCHNNCMRIKHVKHVGCEKGTCKIFSCRAGYTIFRHISKHNGPAVERCALVRKGRS